MEPEELAQRVNNDGETVSLYWFRETNTTEVHVAHTDTLDVLSCRPDEALKVFYHPYAYLSA